MSEKTATEPSPEELKKQEELEEKKKKEEEEKRAEAEKVYQEHVKKVLKECDFKKVDDRRYSFLFKKSLLVFRTPTLIEKARIKSILFQITTDNDSGIFSATDEIYGSGDYDLISTAKLTTHTTVLFDEFPEKFKIDDLSDFEGRDLGYLISICEREFLERKKKALQKDQ